ncbi:MAG: hypothetical protein J6M39_05510 [Lachnospiraceae bacterium]|nr:hypothetical protein [Lachnospiraceae bacterium]
MRILKRLNRILILLVIFITSTYNIVFAEDNGYVFKVISEKLEDEPNINNTTGYDTPMNKFFVEFIVDTCAERVTLYLNEEKVWEHIVMPKQFEDNSIIETKKVISGNYAKCANNFDFTSFLDGREVIYTDTIPQLVQPITEENRRDEKYPYQKYYEDWTEYKDLKTWANYNNGENVYKLVEELGEKDNEAYRNSKGEKVDFESFVKDGAKNGFIIEDKGIDEVIGDYLGGDKTLNDKKEKETDEDAINFVLKFEPMHFQPRLRISEQKKFLGIIPIPWSKEKTFWDILCNNESLCSKYMFEFHKLEVLTGERYYRDDKEEKFGDVIGKKLFIAPTGLEYQTMDSFMSDAYAVNWGLLSYMEAEEDANKIDEDVSFNIHYDGTEALTLGVYENIIKEIESIGVENLEPKDLMYYIENDIIINGTTKLRDYDEYIAIYKGKHSLSSTTVKVSKILHAHNRYYTVVEKLKEILRLFDKKVLASRLGSHNFGAGILVIDTRKIATPSEATQSDADKATDSEADPLTNDGYILYEDELSYVYTYDDIGNEATRRLTGTINVGSGIHGEFSTCTCGRSKCSIPTSGTFTVNVKHYAPYQNHIGDADNCILNQNYSI